MTDIKTGQLVKILPGVKDFYPKLVNRIGLVTDVVQYAGDSLTLKKEFRLNVDGKNISMTNTHPSSTVPIDGHLDESVLLKEEEMFSVIK